MAAITLATRPTRHCAKWSNRLLFSHKITASLTVAAGGRYSSTAHPSSRGDQPFRMAVIGSGPAGFYTAYRAMTRIQGAKVDMYEALPVPFGLVRFGVAPDHPEVKNCQEKFEEVASSPNFTFIGNVSVGTPSNHPDDGATVPLNSILRHYNAVVFAYGAAKDRTLNIPGESTLKGIYSAREFVGWYNGLPEHSHLNPDLTQGDTAVVIGQGNVALDVARMLLSPPSTLAKSDIAEHAISTLSTSRIKHVHIVGRRGPMQAAFTIKEIRELIKLPSVKFQPFDTSLIPQDTSSLPRAQRRLMEILLKGSPPSSSSFSKSWSLDFLLSPKSFLSSPSSPNQLSSTTFETTTLSPTPFTHNAFALPTGEHKTLPSSIAFRSIGYKSLPLPEFEELGIPFNDRWGTISNDRSGRVQHEDRAPDAMMTLASFPGLYCAGWVKRGPTGVIASTMEDAFNTADAIAEDWDKGRAEFLNGTGKGWEAVKSESGVEVEKVVSWEDWKRIDNVEREKGKEKGKVREKFVRTGDMLSVLR
ncbi:mitochondrial putative NADPH:adrenodoxin oxidoreductase [Podospora fimiseda]|uniref:NADPH:adrenodoxin oxidoreductase, mitochondrial n=1 Tax=Podospora fimiseda TaxID=252190 RepID=A0AAN7BV76_9PEZI|nr:mitochondrial putative NADPH:adrenodoxin oxidoreductase [Podospora fimiseda]